MRLIDADALYDAFERTPWMDNADRDIAEEVMDNAPTVNPCDNCIGPALAITHGYKDMRAKAEVDDD